MVNAPLKGVLYIYHLRLWNIKMGRIQRGCSPPPPLPLESSGGQDTACPLKINKSFCCLQSFGHSCSICWVFSWNHGSDSSILYVILFTVSPILLTIFNTEAEDKAEVEEARGRSVPDSRKSTKSILKQNDIKKSKSSPSSLEVCESSYLRIKCF